MSGTQDQQLSRGTKFLLPSALVYSPGTWLYCFARREQRQRVFTMAESMVCGFVAIAALLVLAALLSGRIVV